MSGANKVIPKGHVLFREGEKSDGMYIIRKGELLVYLEKGGSEIKLANLTTGAMLGEMALFDQKPRSASARAITDTEITQISNDDFAKLMKQIPKWFVGLMTTLSTRLRETNERVQKVEALKGAKASKILNVIKSLQLLLLVWHKEGTKDGKNWRLSRKIAEESTSKLLEIPAEEVRRLTDGLVKSNIVSISKDSYNNEELNMANRAVLDKFIEFLTEFNTNNPGAIGLPTGTIQMLNALKVNVDASAYETILISLKDICDTGEKLSLDTSKWKECQTLFAKNKSGITLAKVSDGTMGFKLQKGDYAKVFTNYALFDKLQQTGVL